MPLLVNGESIEDELIEREAASLRQRLEEMPAEQREARGFDASELEKHWWDWSRENVIERTLLRQEALKDTTPIPSEAIETAMAELKKRYGGEQQFAQAYNDEDPLRNDVEARIRLDRLIGKITSKVSPPKNKEVAEFYRKNREQFKLPEMVHAAHIVKNVDEKTDERTARAAIEKVEQELGSGGSFEQLADKHSDCPGNGGDLGYFPRGKMVEEFEQVVFSMAAGEVSPIFRSVFGFHIAKLHEKKEPSVRPLADVQQEIKQEILRQKQTRAIENFVDQLKEKADIKDAPAATPNVESKR